MPYQVTAARYKLFIRRQMILEDGLNLRQRQVKNIFQHTLSYGRNHIKMAWLKGHVIFFIIDDLYIPPFNRV